MKKLIFLILTLFVTKSFAATEIVWWHAMDGALEQEVIEIANAFNSSQSQYKVKPVLKGNYDDIIKSTITAMDSGNDLPALIQLSEATTVSMVYKYRDRFYAISDLMQDFKQNFNVSNFIASVASYYESADGKLYSLPFNASAPIIWYNKDLFAKANIKDPPETWQDMYEVGYKLKSAGVKCPITIGYPSWILLENFSAWHNLEFATHNNGYTGLDTRLKFNNSAIKAFFELLADLSARGIYHFKITYKDLLNSFASEECAMWIGSSSSLKSINAVAKFRIGQAMMPFDERIVEKPQNAIIGGASLWVVQGQSKKVYKGLIEFLKFLSREDLQAIWHTATGYVPITTAAIIQTNNYRLNVVRYGNDTAVKELTLNPIAKNSKGVRVGNLLEIRKIAENQIQKIIAGEISAAQGLDEAVRLGNMEIQKFLQDAKK